MYVHDFFKKFFNAQEESEKKQSRYIPGMKLNYRILDCDMFESYMALESWDNFPYLKSIADNNGAMGYLLQDASYMVFDSEHSNGLLKVICIYHIFGDVLNILFFEVNKEYRHIGLGEAAIELLLLETGCKNIELDAKDDKAASFWAAVGLNNTDTQHFYI